MPNKTMRTNVATAQVNLEKLSRNHLSPDDRTHIMNERENRHHLIHMPFLVDLTLEQDATVLPCVGTVLFWGAILQKHFVNTLSVITLTLLPTEIHIPKAQIISPPQTRLPSFLSSFRFEIGTMRLATGMVRLEIKMANQWQCSTRPDLPLFRPENGMTQFQTRTMRFEMGIVQVETGMFRRAIALVRWEGAIGRFEIRKTYSASPISVNPAQLIGLGCFSLIANIACRNACALFPVFCHWL
jgi:hypothetical protein